MIRSASIAVLAVLSASAQTDDLRWQLRYRTPVAAGSENRHTLTRSETWKPTETAVIVCDVWDKHHSSNATRRGAEVAPRIDAFVAKLRTAGATVIHAPSDCMAFYTDHPARKRAELAPAAPNPPKQVADWCKQLPVEKAAKYPIDQSDGGEDDDPAELARWAKELAAAGRNPRAPWKSQTDLVKIDAERDFVSDKGREIYNILEGRKIRNVLLVGVHTNMCVLGRSFGLRRMVEQGRNAVLVRDLTDTMYNPKMPPFVNHHEGTDRIVAYIESHICSTATSDQLLGDKPFRFAEDRRPNVVVVTSESEYGTEKTLPEFVDKELGKAFRTTMVFGDAKAANELPGIDALAKADVLLLSMRRRTLPAAQLQLFRDHVAAGKPVVATRTSSHAFAASGKQKPPTGSAQWPEFDRDVLGGNYHNHHGNQFLPTVEFTPLAADSPLTQGIEAAPFAAGGSLYKTAPVATGALVLMTGKISNAPAEPVTWTFKRTDGGKTFYTSLGAVDDFRNPRFRRLLVNALYWAAGTESSKAK